MNREEYRCGLWKKQAKSGTKYCSGKLKIGDREFQVTLFNNDKKGNEKAPDFNLIVRDSINTQETQKQVQNEPQNSVREDDTHIYEEFGKQLEFGFDDTDDFPF